MQCIVRTAPICTLFHPHEESGSFFVTHSGKDNKPLDKAEDLGLKVCDIEQTPEKVGLASSLHGGAMNGWSST